MLSRSQWRQAEQSENGGSEPVVSSASTPTGGRCSDQRRWPPTPLLLPRRIGPRYQDLTLRLPATLLDVVSLWYRENHETEQPFRE